MASNVIDITDFQAPNTVPDELKSLTVWLVWRLTQKPGQKKPSKVPFYVNGSPRSGVQGGPDDVAQLASYAQATAACVKGGYSGVGMVLLSGGDVVALDFDYCVTAEGIDPRVAALCEGTYTEYSPSGTGIRSFFRGTLLSRKDTQPKDGSYPLEVFGDSGFVTVTGNITEDCQMFGDENRVAPLTSAVRDEYRRRFGDPQGVIQGALDADDAWLMGLTPKLGWTLTQGAEYLGDCDAGTGRQQWLLAMMAMHHEFDGSAEALEIVNKWSMTASSYVSRADVEGRWRSFGKKGSGGGGTVTGAWLLNWRKQCRVENKYKTTETLKNEIIGAKDEQELREVICPKIKADTLIGEMEREALAQVLYTAFRTMGLKYPIANCRKLLTEKRIVKIGTDIDLSDDARLPEWLKGYVFVTADDKYYNRVTGEWLTVQGFNARYNRYMPRDDNGMVILTASVAALEQYQVMVVVRAMYIPYAPSLFQNSGGGWGFGGADLWNVNTYLASSVPVACEASVEGMSGSAQKAIAAFKKHLSVLCNGRPDVIGQFIKWLAFNVQFPGMKQRWMPVVKGIEGDGKSLIGTLLALVMGRCNVKVISPVVLSSQFSGWAEGSCVGVMEELHLTGHSRHDVMNGLKPFITNDIVEIHKKGKDPYTTINTQNLIAFTNFSNALPIGETDRRHMVIASPFSTPEQLRAAFSDTYFTDLIEGMEKHASEFRRFFLDVDLTGYNPHAPAMMTDEKMAMTAMTTSDAEMLIAEVLDAGGEGITKEVFVSKCVTDALALLDMDTQFTNYDINRAFIKCGYSKLSKRVKWNGRTHIVWYRGTVTQWNDAVRDVLNATLVNDLFL